MEKIVAKKIEKLNERTGRFFDLIEKREITTLVVLFCFSLSIRLGAVNWVSLLQKDAYVYLLKAVEITRGNFIPSFSQSVGLSLFAAPFLLPFAGASIFKLMAVAKVISCLFGAAVIFPLYFLAKELCAKRARTIVLFIFTFWSVLVLSAGEFLTEPLFSFFLLWSLYFVVRYLKNRATLRSAVTEQVLIAPGKEQQQPNFHWPFYLSFFFAGLAYYVRPNGFFVLATLIIAYLVIDGKNWQKKILPLLIGCVIFGATAAPFLWQRAEAFGSPFTYGENDKYFAEDYSQMYADNVPVASALTYFKSHSAKQMFDRFVVGGTARICFDLFRPKDLPLLTFFILLGIGLNIWRKEYWPLYICLLIFIGGLSLIYWLGHTSRYVLPLVPLLIIFIATAWDWLVRPQRFRDLLSGFFIICFIFLSITALVKGIPETVKMPDWATWAAANLRGKLATIEGGDLVIMNLPDAATAGVNQKNLYAPVTGLSVFRPGPFPDLAAALTYFRQIKTTAIVIDENQGARPYLNDIDLPAYKKCFRLVYSDYGRADFWPAKIYAIDWKNCAF